MKTGWRVDNGGVINRFLITPLQEQNYFAEPDTLPDKVNYRFINGFVDVGTLPCRVRFLREEAQRTVVFPETLNFNGLWTSGDDGKAVSFSDFWPTPTHVQRFARAVLLSEHQQSVPFTLSTCGGVTVWLNGQWITRFAPFTRNVTQSCTLDLPLQRGKNTLIIHAEELCERDTDYLFSVCYQGETSLDWQLTDDDALSARWVALDAWLNHLSLQQTLVDQSTLQVGSALPVPEALSVSHRLLCNLNESVPPLAANTRPDSRSPGLAGLPACRTGGVLRSGV